MYIEGVLTISFLFLLLFLFFPSSSLFRGVRVSGNGFDSLFSHPFFGPQLSCPQHFQEMSGSSSGAYNGLRDLNALPAGDIDDTDAFNPDDLALFTNTRFFDFDCGPGERRTNREQEGTEEGVESLKEGNMDFLNGRSRDFLQSLFVNCGFWVKGGVCVWITIQEASFFSFQGVFILYTWYHSLGEISPPRRVPQRTHSRQIAHPLGYARTTTSAP